MNYTDWTGTIGVSVLLIAFFLNVFNKISKDSPTYIIMNIAGAGIACYASVLLHYVPFIILEASWTLVSLAGLFKIYKR